jgi:hypothetical protein
MSISFSVTLLLKDAVNMPVDFYGAGPKNERQADQLQIREITSIVKILLTL